MSLSPAVLLSLLAQDLAAEPPFTVAFQPIVDIAARKTRAYEALVRGLAGEPASAIFDRVALRDLQSFDERCRSAAIVLASRLRLDCDLSLNLLPQSLIAAGKSIRSMVDTAARHHFPLHRIALEVTEGELIGDHRRFAHLTNEFRHMGLKLAIDDFGAGYSGLSLLAEFQPDQIKLDAKLVRGVHRHGPRQAIVRAIAQVCRDLGIELIAEGIETLDEYTWFSDEGVTLFQGYFFARPGFECLPPAIFPPAA